MNPISRRKLIYGGVAAAASFGGLIAAERLAGRYGLIPPDGSGVYGPGETLTYACQRLLTARAPAGLDELVVKLCSYCQRVAWPDDDAVTAPEWIEAAEYYWRGGVSDVVISHAVCENCYQRVIGSLSKVSP